MAPAEDFLLVKYQGERLYKKRWCRVSGAQILLWKTKAGARESAPVHRIDLRGMTRAAPGKTKRHFEVILRGVDAPLSFKVVREGAMTSQQWIDAFNGALVEASKPKSEASRPAPREATAPTPAKSAPSTPKGLPPTPQPRSAGRLGTGGLLDDIILRRAKNTAAVDGKRLKPRTPRGARSVSDVGLGTSFMGRSVVMRTPLPALSESIAELKSSMVPAEPPKRTQSVAEQKAAIQDAIVDGAVKEPTRATTTDTKPSKTIILSAADAPLRGTSMPADLLPPASLPNPAKLNLKRSASAKQPEVRKGKARKNKKIFSGSSRSRSRSPAARRTWMGSSPSVAASAIDWTRTSPTRSGQRPREKQEPSTYLKNRLSASFAADSSRRPTRGRRAVSSSVFTPSTPGPKLRPSPRSQPATPVPKKSEFREVPDVIPRFATEQKAQSLAHATVRVRAYDPPAEASAEGGANEPPHFSDWTTMRVRLVMSVPTQATPDCPPDFQSKSGAQTRIPILHAMYQMQLFTQPRQGDGLPPRLACAVDLGMATVERGAGAILNVVCTGGWRYYIRYATADTRDVWLTHLSTCATLQSTIHAMHPALKAPKIAQNKTKTTPQACLVLRLPHSLATAPLKRSVTAKIVRNIRALMGRTQRRASAPSSKDVRFVSASDKNFTGLFLTHPLASNWVRDLTNQALTKLIGIRVEGAWVQNWTPPRAGENNFSAAAKSLLSAQGPRLQIARAGHAPLGGSGPAPGVAAGWVPAVAHGGVNRHVMLAYARGGLCVWGAGLRAAVRAGPADLIGADVTESGSLRVSFAAGDGASFAHTYDMNNASRAAAIADMIKADIKLWSEKTATPRFHALASTQKRVSSERDSERARMALRSGDWFTVSQGQGDSGRATGGRVRVEPAAEGWLLMIEMSAEKLNFDEPPSLCLGLGVGARVGPVPDDDVSLWVAPAQSEPRQNPIEPPRITLKATSAAVRDVWVTGLRFAIWQAEFGGDPSIRAPAAIQVATQHGLLQGPATAPTKDGKTFPSPNDNIPSGENSAEKLNSSAEKLNLAVSEVSRDDTQRSPLRGAPLPDDSKGANSDASGSAPTPSNGSVSVASASDRKSEVVDPDSQAEGPEDEGPEDEGPEDEGPEDEGSRIGDDANVAEPRVEHKAQAQPDEKQSAPVRRSGGGCSARDFVTHVTLLVPGILLICFTCVLLIAGTIRAAARCVSRTRKHAIFAARSSISRRFGTPNQTAVEAYRRATAAGPASRAPAQMASAARGAQARLGRLAMISVGIILAALAYVDNGPDRSHIARVGCVGMAAVTALVAVGHAAATRVLVRAEKDAEKESVAPVVARVGSAGSKD